MNIAIILILYFSLNILILIIPYYIAYISRKNYIPFNWTVMFQCIALNGCSRSIIATAIYIPRDAYFDVTCIQYFYACTEMKRECFV